MKSKKKAKPVKMNPQRVRKSNAYRSALSRANNILKKPEKLTRLLQDASVKAVKLDKGPITAAKENLFALFRLVRAYSSGEYKNISWTSLTLSVAAIIYFVSPIDLVPDFILALGYLDDVALLTWTIKTIGDELSRFIQWEKNSAQDNPPLV